MAKKPPFTGEDLLAILTDITSVADSEKAMDFFGEALVGLDVELLSTKATLPFFVGLYDLFNP